MMSSPFNVTVNGVSASPFTTRTVVHPEWTEHYLNASAITLSPEAWVEQVRRFLDEHEASALSCDVFGSHHLLRSAEKAWSRSEDLLMPWNFLAGRMDTKAHDGGYQLRAISGLTPKPILHRGRIVGTSFEDELAIYCLLSNVQPTVTNVSEAQQTEEVFQITEAALQECGLDFHDVVRTWFYLDEILAWYPEFNRVRTAYFQSRNIFGGIMPASTGVGAANLDGSAVLAKVLAVRPKSDALQITRVDSPLQCDAYAYGSAFSRALEVADSRARSLFISGTASIEPGGKTVHLGDVTKQLELTLQVVEAILKHRHMEWSDTTQAIAYFRDDAMIPLWKKVGAAVAPIPIVATQCDVCRDDLLFEIELLACRAV